MDKKKWILLVVLGTVLTLIYSLNLTSYLNLDWIKSQQAEFQSLYAQHQLLTLFIFFLSYVLVAALSLPGAAVLTLLSGALFGVFTGFIVVSFASSLGATLAFLASRYVLRDAVQAKFSHRLKRMDDGIKKDGAFYLFTLRLIPLFPFFLVNLLMGLTPMSALKFYLVSQVGMLPGTLVYVNAGTRLGQLESLGGILSPQVLFSFVLLGIFPLIAKKLLSVLERQKAYRKFRHRKPKKTDYNIVVIGAGSAGLVSAYIGAHAQAKVALIEANKMGGDCLNTGCVPSKAIIRSAKLAHQFKTASTWGLKPQSDVVDFPKVMRRVHKVIEEIEPHDSVERYSGFGVECIKGSAKIISPWEVEVGDRTLTTRNIIIATGASPIVPPIPGVENLKPLVSENLWELETLPERLLVLGGGPIGCELAQSFQRLGSQVSLVESRSELLRDGPKVSKILVEQLRSEGVDLHLQTSVVAFSSQESHHQATLDGPSGKSHIIFDQVLFATGRRPNTKGFGLEELDIEISERGGIVVNEYLQTRLPNIYACGDVVGPYQLTHAASHQAWFCAVNAMASPLKKFKVDYRVIPWCTFTDPEVAHVGLNADDAQKAGIEYDVTCYGIDDLDRAIADSENKGFVEVITRKGRDEILGATIVGSHAGELITEFVLAMKHGLGLNKILGTIHIYPTWSEANKYVAGQWRKKRIQPDLLKWAKRFHGYRRG